MKLTWCRALACLPAAVFAALLPAHGRNSSRNPSKILTAPGLKASLQAFDRGGS